MCLDGSHFALLQQDVEALRRHLRPRITVVSCTCRTRALRTLACKLHYSVTWYCRLFTDMSPSSINVSHDVSRTCGSSIGPCRYNRYGSISISGTSHSILQACGAVGRCKAHRGALLVMTR